MSETCIIVHGLPTARRHRRRQRQPGFYRRLRSPGNPSTIRHPRARLPLRRFILPACLLLVVCGFAVLSPAQRTRAATPVPFAPAHAYAAIADRPVCSLLGSDGNGAKVDGQDGSASVVQSGMTFWTFGDSFIGTNVPPPNQPNGLGYSGTPASDSAADCIDLQAKRDGSNTAIPLLPKQQGECSVWSSGLAAVAANIVHLFYIPVPNCSPATPAGIGLATFGTTQVPGFPSTRLGIVWPSSVAVIDGPHRVTNAH